MNFEILYGIPILKTKMPNHEKILERFLPFIENKDNFDYSEIWNCDCKTTIGNQEKNSKFPWDLFFQEVYNVLSYYTASLGMTQDSMEQLASRAWINRYDKNESQEVHHHKQGNNLISCAYMLKLPKDSAEFSFFQPNHDIFPAHLKHAFDESSMFLGDTIKPKLTEGDILFFPSSATHYVNSHKTTELRSTISANFEVIM